MSIREQMKKVEEKYIFAFSEELPLLTESFRALLAARTSHLPITQAADMVRGAIAHQEHLGEVDDHPDLRWFAGEIQRVKVIERANDDGNVWGTKYRIYFTSQYTDDPDEERTYEDADDQDAADAGWEKIDTEMFWDYQEGQYVFEKHLAGYVGEMAEALTGKEVTFLKFVQSIEGSKKRARTCIAIKPVWSKLNGDKSDRGSRNGSSSGSAKKAAGKRSTSSRNSGGEKSDVEVEDTGGSEPEEAAKSHNGIKYDAEGIEDLMVGFASSPQSNAILKESDIEDILKKNGTAVDLFEVLDSCIADSDADDVIHAATRWLEGNCPALDLEDGDVQELSDYYLKNVDPASLSAEDAEDAALGLLVYASTY